MKRKEIEIFLGDNLVVTDIYEDEFEVFAFYTSKQFIESGNNDKYAMIGIGPFYLNKKTQEKRKLGAMEFYSQFSDRTIFKNKLNDIIQITFEATLQNIKTKKHINFDEFEIIMNKMNIDIFRVSISSNDLIHEIIESPDPEDLDKFMHIFEKTELNFVRESLNKLILKN